MRKGPKQIISTGGGFGLLQKTRLMLKFCKRLWLHLIYGQLCSTSVQKLKLVASLGLFPSYTTEGDVFLQVAKADFFNRTGIPQDMH